MTLTLQARPTTYKGIQMRSRMEAGFAAWLDSERFQWTYEPRCYASGEGQYLPDFQVHNLLLAGFTDFSPLFVETKPTTTMAVIRDAARDITIIRATEPDALLLVASLDRRDGATLVAPVDIAGGSEHGYWFFKWMYDADAEDAGRPRLFLATMPDPTWEPWQPGYWE